jgi:hypothetical protein
LLFNFVSVCFVERLNRKLVYVLPFVERQLDVVNHLLKETWLRHTPCNRTFPLYRDNVELVLYTPRVLGKSANDHNRLSQQLLAVNRLVVFFVIYIVVYRCRQKCNNNIAIVFATLCRRRVFLSNQSVGSKRHTGRRGRKILEKTGCRSIFQNF